MATRSRGEHVRRTMGRRCSWAPGRYCLGVEDPFSAGDNVARAVQRRSLPSVLSAVATVPSPWGSVVWASRTRTRPWRLRSVGSGRVATAGGAAADGRRSAAPVRWRTFSAPAETPREAPPAGPDLPRDPSGVRAPQSPQPGAPQPAHRRRRRGREPLDPGSVPMRTFAQPPPPRPNQGFGLAGGLGERRRREPREHLGLAGGGGGAPPGFGQSSPLDARARASRVRRGARASRVQFWRRSRAGPATVARRRRRRRRSFDRSPLFGGGGGAPGAAGGGGGGRLCSGRCISAAGSRSPPRSRIPWRRSRRGNTRRVRVRSAGGISGTRRARGRRREDFDARRRAEGDASRGADVVRGGGRRWRSRRSTRSTRRHRGGGGGRAQGKFRGGGAGESAPERSRPWPDGPRTPRAPT